MKKNINSFVAVVLASALLTGSALQGVGAEELTGNGECFEDILSAGEDMDSPEDLYTESGCEVYLTREETDTFYQDETNSPVIEEQGYTEDGSETAVYTQETGEDELLSADALETEGNDSLVQEEQDTNDILSADFLEAQEEASAEEGSESQEGLENSGLILDDGTEENSGLPLGEEMTGQQQGLVLTDSNEELVLTTSQDEPDAGSSQSTRSVRLAVNQSQTVYVYAESGETFNSGLWDSNSSNVSISSYGGNSCTITGLSATNSPVIVSCTYYCIKRTTIGGRTINQSVKHYADFSVTVTGGNGDNSSATGAYTLDSSSYSVNLDCAGPSYAEITLTAGVNLSSSVYITDDSSSGNRAYASLDRIVGNKAYYTLYANSVGRQTITFKLVSEVGSVRYIKKSISVTVNVTCSHVYDNGTVTKEPTATSTGIRTYTCRNCGYQKTETIPAISNAIADCTVTLAQTSYTYNGQECKPAVTVKKNGAILAEGTDYKVAYKNNTNAGTAEVTVTGIGGYTGNATKTFTIGKAEQNLNVNAGNSLKVKGTLQINASGVGTITYASSNTGIAQVNTTGLVTGKSAGTVKITVTASGNNNYKDASKEISITVTEDKPAVISLSKTVLELKKGEKGVITVTAGGTLPEWKDWVFSVNRPTSGCCSLAWTGSWNGNSHDLTITGTGKGSEVLNVSIKDRQKGEYIASVSLTVRVSEQIKSVSVCSITLGRTEYTYSGKANKPSVTVKDGRTRLTRGRDYSLTYSSNVNAGRGRVTISGMGSYTGTVTRYFTIRKASQNIRLSATSIRCKSSSLRYSSGRTRVTVRNARGRVTFTSNSRYITVNNSGLLVIRKGTRRGTYRVTVRAASTANYLAAKKTITIYVQ